MVVTALLLLMAGSPFRPVPDDPAAARPAPNAAPDAPRPAGEVANLPFARGRTFRTLDEYLAHLETQGAIDLPWWRQVAPGLYEHVTTKTGAKRETATRAELMKRFGFSK